MSGLATPRSPSAACDVKAGSAEFTARVEADVEASEVVRQLRTVLRDGAQLFPLPAVPRPPLPQGRGRRTRRRHHLAVELWGIAERCRRALNTCENPMYRDKYDSNLRLADESIYDCDAIGRVRRCAPHNIDDDVHTIIHLHLLSEAKRVREGRRLSVSLAETGASLVQLISRHTQGNDYGARSRVTPYAPFMSDYIKEPPADSCVVNMLNALPREVSVLYTHVDSIVKPGILHTSTLQRLNKQY